MARLIDMDELLNEFEALKNKAETLQDAIYLDAVMAVIDTAPTIDGVPAVHGTKIARLNDVFSEKIITVCSECSGRVGKRDVYCRHCGAKMDLDDGEDWEG